MSVFSIGDVITFATSDSKKFGNISNSLIYMFITPISGIFGIIYLYILFGYSTFVGVSIMLILMIVNYIYVKRGMFYQKEYMKSKSERIKKTSEMFNNIKYIKTSNLELFFGNKIQQIRDVEMK